MNTFLKLLSRKHWKFLVEHKQQQCKLKVTWAGNLFLLSNAIRCLTSMCLQAFCNWVLWKHEKRFPIFARGLENVHIHGYFDCYNWNKQRRGFQMLFSLLWQWNYFSRRWSGLTDRNVELKPSVFFRTTPTHLEIIKSYFHRAKFQILLTSLEDIGMNFSVIKLSDRN